MNLAPRERSVPPMAEELLDEWLRSCIHCGLCLNDCPTYRLTGDEAESPRGRLVLMRDILFTEPAEGFIPAELGRDHLDRCLGCLGCQTVCPSGVPYGDLLERTRSRLGPAPEIRSRLLAWIIDQVLPRPRWLAVFSAAGQTFARLWPRALTPPRVRTLVDGLPTRPAHWPRALASRATGNVAVLAGCAQTVYTPEVLPATMRLLEAAGAEPYLPAGQGCCGALSHHQGSDERARELARQNVDAFGSAPTIVVPSAGCSAHMRHYGELLADDTEYAARAAQVAARCVDLVVWLQRHGDSIPLREDVRRVAYHPPCHHSHAQGIESEPLELLDRVPGLSRVPVARASLCCGSAGSYSLQQPELALAQREAKLQTLLAGDPELILTANPGCEMFLQAGLAERQGAPPIEHLAVYLDRQRAEIGGSLSSDAQKG